METSLENIHSNFQVIQTILDLQYNQESNGLRYIKGEKTDMILSEFMKEYLEYSKSFHTQSSHISARAALNEFQRIVGNVPISNIGIKEIENFVAIKRKKSVFTARRCFVTVAAAFKKACDWNYLDDNPFRNVTKPKLPEIPPRYFQKNEFKEIYQLIEDLNFKELCVVAVYTGMRQGELINLRWENVNINERSIQVSNSEEFTTKSKKNRTVPMNEPVFDILVCRKGRASCDYVFCRDAKKLKRDYVSRKFKRYVRLAGVNDKLTFHSLRHTCASWMVQAGVSLYVVQKILGHSSITVTEKYAHLQKSQLFEAIEKLRFEPDMHAFQRESNK